MLAAPHHYLISIQRGGVALVAVCMQEVAPLFVIEFLHRVVDTFQVSNVINSPKLNDRKIENMFIGIQRYI